MEVSAWLRRARSLGGGLTQWLFPPLCLACGQPVDSPSNPGRPYTCSACLVRLPWKAGLLPGPAEGPGPEGHPAGENSAVAWGIRAVPPLEALSGGVWGVFDYEDPVKHWLWRLKYSGADMLARPLGHLMATGMPPVDFLAGESTAPDCIVAPVPLHPARLRARGYNQSLLLAHEWLLAGGFGPGKYLVPNLLRRKRATLPQVELDAEHRQANVAGAFALGSGVASPLAGRRVVLVDDVLTTGATLEACASVLHRAGAAQVTALALAQLDQPLT